MIYTCTFILNWYVNCNVVLFTLFIKKKSSFVYFEILVVGFELLQDLNLKEYFWAQSHILNFLLFFFFIIFFFLFVWIIKILKLSFVHVLPCSKTLYFMHLKKEVSMWCLIQTQATTWPITYLSCGIDIWGNWIYCR